MFLKFQNFCACQSNGFNCQSKNSNKLLFRLENKLFFQAIVKAFAASNSSQISEAQLREELGKELEQSVSLILDELGRKDKTTKHPVTSTTQSVPAEELERLEGEEEATTLPKETENSVVSTREATSLQTASTTTGEFF